MIVNLNKPVYVKTDNFNRVISVKNSNFLGGDWIKVEGDIVKYRFSLGPKSFDKLVDNDGIYLYKLVDNTVVRRTPEEMASDKEEIAKLSE